MPAVLAMNRVSTYLLIYLTNLFWINRYTYTKHIYAHCNANHTQTGYTQSL